MRFPVSLPRRLMALLTPVLLALSVHGQFYAPETQFHDLCQRHFAVEAARVLAWLDCQRGAPVASVAYEFKTNATGNQWRLGWLDANGKEIRTATVQYPRTALTNGISFYRDVFRQLGGASNLVAGKPVAPAAMEKAFWDGAERAGYSRMEAMEAAFSLWQLKKGELPAPEHVMQLAGLLAQTPTHGFWEESALDAKLIARAAAWLCVAESAGKSNDSLWSPILFIAGREWQASVIWSPRQSPAVAEWWDVLLRGKPARDAFVFVAAPEQRSRAMAMMVRQANISDGYFIAIGHLIQPLFGRQKSDFQRLYDYGPGFSDSTVENGHLLNGWWPVLARAAWVKTLKSYPASDQDYQGYVETLDKVADAIKEPNLSLDSQEEDNSTRQLDVVAPLLRVAYNESSGPLVPVPHVTARDLLHFGWENAALQIVARHYFVQSKWNVRELAQAIHEAGTNHIPQLGVLMSTATNAAKAAALHRLQYVNWTFGGNWPAAGIKTGNALTNDLSGMSTHWLRPSMANWLYNWWFWAHTPEERRPIMNALSAEGGRWMNLRMLRFLVSDSRSKPEIVEVGSRLTNGLQYATGLMSEFYRRTSPATNWTGVPSADECRQMENLFLTNPNSTLSDEVFHMYLLAGEFPAAKSFYEGAMTLPFDAVSYTIRMGSPRWILAMFENDREAMRKVVTEHETGSMADFVMQINDALYREDYNAAQKTVQEAIARYGTGRSNAPNNAEVLRRLLARRKALADPSDTEHANAVGSMTDAPAVGISQWILIKNLKLSQADALRFLGGEKATGVRKLMIHYLQKDTKGFAETLRNLNDLPGSTCAVAGWLGADLFKRRPTLEAALIQSTPVKPVEDLVAERLR